MERSVSAATPSMGGSLQRATSVGFGPQAIKMERAVSAATPSLGGNLQLATSVGFGSDEASEYARLHMEQLQLAAQLVMSDCRRSGDTEMQSLLKQVMDAASKKLGP